MNDTHEFRQLSWFKKRDKLRFDVWTAGLPAYPENWPYGCGPHSVASMEMLVNVMHPLALLEIGLNLGRSSAIWLNLDIPRVASVDINKSDIVREAGTVLKTKFPRQFDFMLVDAGMRDSAVQARWSVFDMVFIDGGHDFADVQADIALARAMSIRRMVFDDYHPHWGPGVMQAVADAKLKIHAIFGTMAYCEDVSEDRWEIK